MPKIVCRNYFLVMPHLRAEYTSPASTSWSCAAFGFYLWNRSTSLFALQTSIWNSRLLEGKWESGICKCRCHASTHRACQSYSVVWSVLVLELIFEVIIRPPRYSELIQSDRAFAPSTARYINRFHLIFEGIALITYVPNFACLSADDICWRESRFSRVMASMDAIVGETHAQSAKGRFFLGLTVLRLFGLIRHWKQMFINNTFQSVKREGIEKWLIPRQNDHGDSIVSTTHRHSKKRDVSMLVAVRFVQNSSTPHTPSLFRMTMRASC